MLMPRYCSQGQRTMIAMFLSINRSASRTTTPTPAACNADRKAASTFNFTTPTDGRRLAMQHMTRKLECTGHCSHVLSDERTMNMLSSELIFPVPS
ncbi:hypothetical protein V6N11_014627 [Hibiscus sabdariffa]|uniref:Uncharacterized protein n=1 Tax=Hibiscus sabdariffa TaxID=183260 RepID=A0ABR2TQF3_9ROSI